MLRVWPSHNWWINLVGIKKYSKAFVIKSVLYNKYKKVYQILLYKQVLMVSLHTDIKSELMNGIRIKIVWKFDPTANYWYLIATIVRFKLLGN